MLGYLDIFDLLTSWVGFFIFLAIIIFLIQVLILRWIFRVDIIAQHLANIEQELSRHTLQINELNAKSKDIRVLLASIDGALNRTKKDAETMSKDNK